MRYSLILLSFISLSCIEVEEIISIPKYSVYCILNPDDTKVEVFLGHTYSINESFPIDSGKYIKNAIVKIKDDNQSISLNLNTKTKKYEANNLGFLKENKKYYLQVVIDKDTLNAQTTIPQKPELLVEEARVIGNEAQIRVSWTKDRTKETFYRLLGNVDTGTASNPLFYWDNEFGIWRTRGEYSKDDYIKSPIGNFVFQGSNDKVIVFITLESLDSNWYQFRNKLDALLIRDSFTKRFESPIYYQSNVSNSVGVFGSFTQTNINIKLNK